MKNLFDFLNLYKTPYHAWTLYKSKRPKKAGAFVQVSFHYNIYGQIPAHWRHALRDLAEYQGGP